MTNSKLVEKLVGVFKVPGLAYVVGLLTLLWAIGQQKALDEVPAWHIIVLVILCLLVDRVAASLLDNLYDRTYPPPEHKDHERVGWRRVLRFPNMLTKLDAARD